MIETKLFGKNNLIFIEKKTWSFFIFYRSSNNDKKMSLPDDQVTKRNTRKRIHDDSSNEKRTSSKVQSKHYYIHLTLFIRGIYKNTKYLFLTKTANNFCLFLVLPFGNLFNLYFNNSCSSESVVEYEKLLNDL